MLTPTASHLPPLAQLSFPALASISTDVKVPFLLRLSLPRGSRPKTDTVRMSLLRSVISTTKFGVLKIETAVPMQTPSGQAGVKVEGLTRREDQVRDFPHRLGAEVQIFEGMFTLEGYTIPARQTLAEAPATEGLGLLTPGTSTLLDPSQRTVPSFTFKNLKLSYSLLVQVDIDLPSTSPGAHAFEEGIGQLKIPTICVANDGATAARQPRMEVEQLQSFEGVASTSAGGSTSSQTSRLQGLPTYSSLYLRDMARRAAAESNTLVAQAELEGEGEGDEDSSISCESALEGLENDQNRDTVDSSTPYASTETAHPPSSRETHAPAVQGLLSPQATPSEAQPAAALPLSPSPSYISQTGFPFSSLHNSQASTQGAASSHSPVQAPEEDGLQTTMPTTTQTTTSAETADNLSDCTTDTLPPGYPLSVRTALGWNGRNGERGGGSTSVGAGAGTGNSSGGGSAPALTREMRAIEAYLGARNGRIAGL